MMQRMKQDDKEFLERFQLQSKISFQIPKDRLSQFMGIYIILIGIVMIILVFTNINWINVGLEIIYIIYGFYNFRYYGYYIIQSEKLCPIQICYDCQKAVLCAIYISNITKREILFLYDKETRIVISDIIIGSWNSVSSNNRKILSDYVLSNGEINYTQIGAFHTHPNGLRKLQFSKLDLDSKCFEQIVCHPKSLKCLQRLSDGTERSIDFYDYFKIKKENVK